MRKLHLSILVLLAFASTSWTGGGATMMMVGGTAAVAGGGGGSPSFTYENKRNSAVGKVVQLTGVTAGDLVVSLLQWQDSNVTPTISDGSSSWSYATVKINTAEYIRLAYTLSSVASGTVTYTWTATGGGGHTSHAIAVASTGTVSLDTIDAIGSGASGTATSGSETSAEAVMVAFGATGSYTSSVLYTGTLDGVSVTDNTTVIDSGYGATGALTVRIMNNPGTYNSVMTFDGTSNWVSDLIAFKAN